MENVLERFDFDKEVKFSKRHNYLISKLNYDRNKKWT